jgi:hypothetical protein
MATLAGGEILTYVRKPETLSRKGNAIPDEARIF